MPTPSDVDERSRTVPAPTPVGHRVTVTRHGGPDVLSVVPLTQVPVPGPGAATIAVEASSVTFTDTLLRRGMYPYLDPPLPFVLGYDFVGRVVAVGPGVDGRLVGRRVADVPRTGANATYVVRPSDQLVPVPDDLDPAEAEVLLLSGTTAYQLLNRVAGVRRGQRVLVHGGAGAVGSLLVRLAVAAGAVVTATVSAGKRDLVEMAGATALDYADPGVWGRLRAAAPDGFDVVFDGVGIANQARSFRLLTPTGVLVTYGYAADAGAVRRRSPATKVVGALLFALVRLGTVVAGALPGQRRIADYDLSTWRDRHPAWFAEDVAALMALLADGTIVPDVDQRVPLRQARAAHERLARGEVRGRVVLVDDSGGA